MLKMVERTSRRAFVLASVVVFAVSSPAAAQDATPIPYEAPENIDEISGSIESDGSSTVGPVTEAVIEEFAGVAPEVQVVNSISGTGGGFGRFCNGETDIQNASRPIADDERATCAENGVAWYAFQVAIDGLTVVVNPENDFVECLTTDQLFTIFSATGQSWSAIDPSFPDEAITSYAPGTDSGTYDYFSEAIMQGGDVVADEYSEDDNVLVQGVTGDEFGIGFFGYAYYEQNQDALRAVAIDGGSGCVTPSAETVQDNSYAPLSRPLFVYVKAESLQRPEVQEFMRFYLANLTDLVPDVGYIALPAAGYLAQQEKLEGGIAGTATPDSEAAGTPEA
jgi:phosphate transport system substrate-binding protein